MVRFRARTNPAMQTQVSGVLCHGLRPGNTPRTVVPSSEPDFWSLSPILKKNKISCAGRGHRWHKTGKMLLRLRFVWLYPSSAPRSPCIARGLGARGMFEDCPTKGRRINARKELRRLGVPFARVLGLGCSRCLCSAEQSSREALCPQRLGGARAGCAKLSGPAAHPRQEKLDVDGWVSHVHGCWCFGARCV